MLNIRERFREVLEEYGHTVVYIRADQRFRCSCYNERNGEAKLSGCTKCFGIGYKTTIEQVLTRRTPLSMPETLVAVRRGTSPGNLVVAGYTYYMEHTVIPKSGDMIYEVIWENGKPKRVKEKLLISAVDQKAGVNGRTEFYQVYARTHWLEEGDMDGINKI